MKLISFMFLFLCVSPLLAEIPATQLSEQTLERFKLVPEFEFIIQEAEKLGVKVYLFGGTASAFAHYVRWDLEREAGDTKYQAERFDYDFTNIYRGNQDLDIVVDGSPEQADALKAILQEAYPHFIGNRDAWEVRLLRQSRGDKQALLGDEDFKKQHSDTNSTGMLLLNPDPGGIVYNDLSNWGSHESDFLNDVAAARIKFLFSEEHEDTQRFQDGKNPPVLAAIRYLAKLAQYEVQGTTEDLKTVTQIIQETDFTTLSAYGKKKAEEFALKTLLNAPDSEYAWNLLEKTGARKKLIEMDGERFQEQESLSWWMNKEPLRSIPIDFEGSNQNKTAQEIFGDAEIILSHETNSFIAYDNITRSSQGKANVFISRANMAGEAAVHGDGFYTRRGLEGARGTGLTIRFKLHPQAQEGKDFTQHYDYIVVKNKNALTLIQENLNINLSEFLDLLLSGDISVSDLGLKEKFIRKFKRISSNSDEFKEALIFVKSLFEVASLPSDFDQVTSSDELIRFTAQNLQDTLDEHFDEFLKELEDPESKREEIKIYLKYSSRGETIVRDILSQAWVRKYPELISLAAKNKELLSLLIKYVFSQKIWSDQKQIFNSIVSRIEGYEAFLVILHVFAQGFYTDQFEYLQPYQQNNPSSFHYVVREAYVEGKLNDPWDYLESISETYFYPVLNVIASHPSFWSKKPSLIDRAMESLKDAKERVTDSLLDILSHPDWPVSKEVIQKLLSYNNEVSDDLVISLLTYPQWYFPDIVKQLMSSKLSRNNSIRFTRISKVAKEIIPHKNWAKHREEFVDYLLRIKGRNKKLFIEEILVQYVFPRFYSQRYKQLILKFIKKDIPKSYEQNENQPAHTFVHTLVANEVLYEKKWFDQPEIIHALISKNNNKVDENIVNYVLTQPYAAKYDWADVLFARAAGTTPQVHKNFVENLFHLEHWKHKINKWYKTILKYEDDTLKLIALGKSPYIKNSVQHFEKLIQKNRLDTQEFHFILVHHNGLLDLMFENPQLMNSYIKKNREYSYIVTYIFENVLSNPKWYEKHTDFVRVWIESFLESHPRLIYQHVLNEDFWADEINWFAQILSNNQIKNTYRYDDDFQTVFSHWEAHPLVRAYQHRGNIQRPFTNEVFSNLDLDETPEHAIDFDEWLKKQNTKSSFSCQQILF